MLSCIPKNNGKKDDEKIEVEFCFIERNNDRESIKIRSQIEDTFVVSSLDDLKLGKFDKNIFYGINTPEYESYSVGNRFFILSKKSFLLKGLKVINKFIDVFKEIKKWFYRLFGRFLSISLFLIPYFLYMYMFIYGFQFFSESHAFPEEKIYLLKAIYLTIGVYFLSPYLTINNDRLHYLFDIYLHDIDFWKFKQKNDNFIECLFIKRNTDESSRLYTDKNTLICLLNMFHLTGLIEIVVDNELILENEKHGKSIFFSSRGSFSFSPNVYYPYVKIDNVNHIKIYPRIKGILYFLIFGIYYWSVVFPIRFGLTKIFRCFKICSCRAGVQSSPGRPKGK